MASIINVDQIAEATNGSGVQIPGHVIQQVNATTTTHEATTSNTFVDTALHVIITPKNNSSKILLLGSISIYQDTNNSVGSISVKRDSTNLGHSNFGLGYIYASAGGAIVHQLPISHLDSPLTTSAITYRVLISRASTGTGAAQISINNTPSSLIALEIAQ